MRTVVAGFVIAACFAASFAIVVPNNFGGWDEWFYMSLVAKGVLSVPYANRPLVFLMAQPVAWLGNGSIWSYFFLHGAYLTAAGFMTFLIVRRLASFPVALLSGIFAAVYAPTDFLRLDSVLMTGYAGFTFAAMTALFCLVEAGRHGSLALLLAGALVGSVAARGFEGILPLLLVAPVLLAFLEAPDARVSRLRFALLWGVGLIPIVALAGWPILHPPAGGSYQSTLGFDPRPLEVVRRVLTLCGFVYRPLVSPPFQSGALPAALGAVLVFVLGWLVALRTPSAPTRLVESRRRLGALCGLGLFLAIVAWSPFALTASTVGPARSQYLSAAGTGLSLAAACALLASFANPRFRVATTALLACWVVAVAATSTFDLQRQWNASSSWEPQRSLLSRLVARVPDVRPNTLLILLDGQEAFPANFTFRHAVELLYEGRALGLAWGAKPFLYPARLTEAGVSYEPMEAVRAAWRVAATQHRWSEVVFVRWSGLDLAVVESWPAGFGAVAKPADYHPLSRIVATAEPPTARRLLR